MLAPEFQLGGVPRWGWVQGAKCASFAHKVQPVGSREWSFTGAPEWAENGYTWVFEGADSKYDLRLDLGGTTVPLIGAELY